MELPAWLVAPLQNIRETGNQTYRSLRRFSRRFHYLTTMDFLNTVFEKHLLDQAECDIFIYNVISQGWKLPSGTIKKFRDSL